MRRHGAAAVDEFNSGPIVAQYFAKPQAGYCGGLLWGALATNPSAVRLRGEVKNGELRRRNLDRWKDGRMEEFRGAGSRGARSYNRASARVRNALTVVALGVRMKGYL